MRKNIITTERLTLHPFAECDEQRMIEIFCNEQIKQTYMIPDFQDMEQAKALFRRMMELSKSDDHFTYGIYLGGELIGFINDCEMSDTDIELGYVILPEHQGKGYATEAVRAAIHELFRIGIKRVTAGFFEENHASQRVMEKCGMHRIEQEDDIEYRGAVHHCLYYGIHS